MSKQHTAYCGWTNYETWCVSLWIDNEEPSYRYWRDEARRQQAAALQCHQVREGLWTVDAAARFHLADQLKDELTEGSPLDEPSVYADLLQAALDEVNWAEIAEHLATDDNEGEPGGQQRPAFSPGQIVATRGVLDRLSPEDVAQALRRHLAGDWGDVDDTDRTANEEALTQDLRLLSVYHAADGVKFWIITEADRSATTVLLPDEY